MPKSKNRKQHKNKSLAYKNLIKGRRKKLRNAIMQNMQESRKKEMESKLATAQQPAETKVEGLNDFVLDEQPQQPPASSSETKVEGLNDFVVEETNSTTLQSNELDLSQQLFITCGTPMPIGNWNNDANCFHFSCGTTTDWNQPQKKNPFI